MPVGETLKWVFHCVQDHYEGELECQRFDDNNTQMYAQLEAALYYGLPSDDAMRAVWEATRARSLHHANRR